VSWLYVIRSPSGLRKVGYTCIPKARLTGIRNANAIRESGEFIYEHFADCGEPLLRTAEKHAHVMLWDTHRKGEWFDVDLVTAQMAIDAGIGAAQLGWSAPQKPDAVTRKLALVMTAEEFQELEDACITARRRSMSGFARQLIREALAARAADA
jgi:hypothetical protein